MIPPLLQDILKDRLATKLKKKPEHLNFQPVGGGSINHTFRLTLDNKHFFCKLNSASKFPHLFKAEKNGLELILKQNIIKTPAVIDYLEWEDKQILLLEWVDQGERTESF